MPFNDLMRRRGADIELPSTGINNQNIAIGQPEQEETKEENDRRTLARALSRTYETLGSMPKALGETGQWIGNKVIQGVSGKENVLGKNIPFLPSAEDLEREFTAPFFEALSGEKGYLNPRSDWEALPDNIIKYGLPFLFDTSGKTKAQTAFKALKYGSAAALSKFGATKIGLGELGQDVSALGGMLFTGWLGTPGAIKFAEKLFGSYKKIPNNSQANLDPFLKVVSSVKKNLARGPVGKFSEEGEFLRGHLKNLQNKLGRYNSSADKKLLRIQIKEAKNALKDVSLTASKSTFPTDAKDFVNSFISDVTSKVQPNGNIEVKELPTFLKLYNQAYRDNKVPNGAKPYMHTLLNSFKDVYKTAPKDVRPLLDDITMANSIWANTRTLSNIQNFMKDKPVISALTSGIGASAYTLLGLSNPAVSILAPLVGAGVSGLSFIKRLYSSKGLQFYYGGLLKSLVSENLPSIVKAADNFNRQYEKEAKKDPSLKLPPRRFSPKNQR